MSRTDIHAPSSAAFDPAAYSCWGCYDNAPEFPDDRLAEFHETVKSLREQGYRLGNGSSHNCGHCGAAVRYFALLVREDVKEFICVGETCLDNRFSLAADEFQALRKAAKLNRERATRDERIASLVQGNPAIAQLAENGDDVQASEFLSDVRWKFLDAGRLSEAQVAAVERAFAGIERRKQWAAERRERAVALAAAGIRAPEGRVEVCGDVVSIKWKDSAYSTGGSWKAVVRTEAGWSAWVTLPAAIADQFEDVVEGVRGKRLRLTATLTRSPSDPTFAFAKRPAKAELLALT